MKIREIRAAGLRGETPKGGWSSELLPDDCVQTLIAVLTDEGLVGWGSAFTSECLVRGALEILRPFYAGQSALEPERLSEVLHQNTFWMGRGGSVTHTISGIDIALWDLLGQATGQPVGRLLGGRYRDRVRPYASLLMSEPQQMAEDLCRLNESGFRAFKVGWGPFGRCSNTLDERIVRAARDTIGPDRMLMVDAGASDAFWEQDYKWALRTAHMLAEYDVAWFEEPLVPDAMADYASLRRCSAIAIAAGEVLTRRQSFLPWLQAGALDIVQPDATKVGGISESRRIGWLAGEYGARLIPHGWNTGIGLAADLHLASALPNTNLIEYLTGAPFIDCLLAEKWTLDENGMLPVPERPGLGITVNLEALERYSGAADFLN